MKQNKHLKRIPWLLCLIAVCGLSFLVGARHTAQADDLQPLIDAVTQEIANNQAIVNQHHAEADTLNSFLAASRADLAASRGHLNLIRLQLLQTQQQLADNKLVIAQQEDLLGQNIAVYYKNGNITPIEVLASSDNLSEFVGRQEYYASMRRKIDSSLSKIRDAKKKLEDLKGDLTRRQTEEQLNEVAIAKKEASLNEMLAQTQGNERIYQALVDTDKLKLTTLRAQQSAAIAAQSAGRTFDITSEYPWASVEPFPSQGVDPWGFYYRQCTSYAAWRRAQLGRPIPAWGFLGPANAKDWPNWGKSSGLVVDTTPEVGALGVYSSGEYGHVMVVEAIVGNGQTVLVSEFNADWGGRYSQSLWPISSLTFMH